MNTVSAFKAHLLTSKSKARFGSTGLDVAQLSERQLKLKKMIDRGMQAQVSPASTKDMVRYWLAFNDHRFLAGMLGIMFEPLTQYLLPNLGKGKIKVTVEGENDKGEKVLFFRTIVDPKQDKPENSHK